jgi:hypothetical protein
MERNPIFKFTSILKGTWYLSCVIHSRMASSSLNKLFLGKTNEVRMHLTVPKSLGTDS